jgi:hypothetical protein
VCHLVLRHDDVEDVLADEGVEPGADDVVQASSLRVRSTAGVATLTCLESLYRPRRMSMSMSHLE